MSIRAASIVGRVNLALIPTMPFRARLQVVPTAQARTRRAV
jgi:hypothetical protein